MRFLQGAKKICVYCHLERWQAGICCDVQMVSALAFACFANARVEIC